MLVFFKFLQAPSGIKTEKLIQHIVIAINNVFLKLQHFHNCISVFSIFIAKSLHHSATPQTIPNIINASICFHLTASK